MERILVYPVVSVNVAFDGSARQLSLSSPLLSSPLLFFPI